MPMVSSPPTPSPGTNSPPETAPRQAYETIGVMAFNLHEEGKVLLSAALATLIVAVSLAGHFVARYLAGAPAVRDA